MTQAKFLITGATGATGGYAVRQLLAKKQAVRVLAHRADDRSKQLRELGADVVLGDFLDFDALRAALQGVQRAYFCYPISPGIVQATAQFAQASKEAGVEVIVNMSQKSARSDAKSEAARQHWLGERVFDWSGVPAVHLRPTFFADWLLNLAPMIRQGRMPVPFGRTGRHAPVAPEDQARLIVAVLQDPGPHIGKTYPLFGPVELTQPEIAAIVGKVLGKEVKYEHVPIERFAELRSGRSNQPPQNTSASFYSDPGAFTAGSGKSYVIQHLREVAIDHDNGIFAGTNNYIADIGGRQPMTVEEFVSRNREAFVMEDTFMPISAPAMSTSKQTLTAALEAGDLQAAVAAFRQDIVFHTPILATVGDEVRGLPTLAKILQTAFTCLGMPQNVEEFQNPDGRYIVTFDGAIDGNLIQIAMLVTEDAQGKVESIRAFTRPWPVVKLFREYMERNLRPDPVPDALWELPASKARQ